jgi:flagellar capping protein FliD
MKRIEKERLEAQLTSQKRTFNGLAGMSLAEAMEEEPVSFSGKKKEEDGSSGKDLPKKKKKEVRLDDLRSVLKGIANKNKEKGDGTLDEVAAENETEGQRELSLESLGSEKEENSEIEIQTNGEDPAETKIEKIDPGQVVKF